MRRKRLSVIIPVYNEEATIYELLEKVRLAPLAAEKELIIVDDGSTDSSLRIVTEWIDGPGALLRENIVLVSKLNGGKGSAVREGIKRSTGDAVIIQDADLEYNPGDYSKCVAPVFTGRAMAVYGSRELSAGRKYSYFSFFMGGLFVTNWMNLLFGSELTDEPTCYKAFNGDFIRSLEFRGDGFEWEPEITAKVLRLGYTIKEVPIEYVPRPVEDGKKISWRDGVKALWVALVWRFRPFSLGRVSSVSAFAAHLKRRRREKLIIFFIVLLAVFLRISLGMYGYFRSPESLLRPDSATYIGPALSLVENFSYNLSPWSSSPAFLRPPGVSLVLACFFSISSNLLLPSLFFCMAGGFASLLIYKTGKLIGGGSVGVFAAFLFAVNVTAFSNAPLILSDTCFGFMVACAMYFIVRFYFFKRFIYLFLGAVAAAGCTYLRTGGLLWFFPLAFIVFFIPSVSVKRRFQRSALFVAVFWMFLLPWMFRNYFAGGGFRMDTLSGEMLFHNGAVLISEISGKRPSDVRRELRESVNDEFRSNPGRYADEASRVEYKLSRLKKLIIDNFPVYIRIHSLNPMLLLPDIASFYELLGVTSGGRGTFDVLRVKGFPSAVKHYFRGRMWLAAIALPLAALACLVYVLGFIQVVLWLKEKHFMFVLFFLGFSEYFIFIPGPITMPRYQIPALPFLCVCAGLAATRLASWISNRRKRIS